MADYAHYTAALTDVLRDAFPDAEVTVQQPSASLADFTPHQVPRLSFAGGCLRVEVYAAQQSLDDYAASEAYVPPAGFSELASLVVDVAFHSLIEDDDYFWNTRGLALPARTTDVPKPVAEALTEMIDILRDHIGEFEEQHINTELSLALASYDDARGARG